jgi:hypothetical protein
MSYPLVAEGKMAAPITAGRVFSYQMQGKIGVLPQLCV